MSTHSMQPADQWRSTTVIGMVVNGRAAMAADGQVTLGDVVMKNRARKVRRLYHDRVLAGFAGASADAFTLYGRFEAKLEEFRGNLSRAAVELARDWRTDRALRRLEAMLAVVDSQTSLLVGGNGDVVEPDDSLVAIGSGRSMALAAGRALLRVQPEIDPADLVRISLEVAASLCIYTNSEIIVETIGA